MPEKKARNMTVKRVPFCKSTVNKIVKEKAKYGDLMDGPSPKTRLSVFDRLSLEMKDKIRFKVSWNMTENFSLKALVMLSQCFLDWL